MADELNGLYNLVLGTELTHLTVNRKKSILADLDKEITVRINKEEPVLESEELQSEISSIVRKAKHLQRHLKALDTSITVRSHFLQLAPQSPPRWTPQRL